MVGSNRERIFVIDGSFPKDTKSVQNIKMRVTNNCLATLKFAKLTVSYFLEDPFLAWSLRVLSYIIGVPIMMEA